jgi:hypothetical protein
VSRPIPKLLTGRPFTGFDERVAGPMDLRFKRSLGNAIRNMIEKEKNRQHYLPTVPIQHEFEPGRWSTEEDDDERRVRDFRQPVRRRLGGLGIAVLGARLAGEETKSLVGLASLGSPDKNVIKRIVREVKELAREHAVMGGAPEMLRRVERAMEEEEATFEKRRATTAASREKVGA